MTLFEEIIAFLFPSALKFYWPFWLQKHIVLNFLFLKPNSFWPHLQSFLFLSLVPDTETRMLGVILDFSTPTVPIQLQDSLGSFLKIWSLKTDPFIFPFLPTSPPGLLHNNGFIICCFYHCILPTSTCCSQQCQGSVPEC